ncbi:MAG: hypothetical protein V3S29_09005 [bacterium]
MKKTLGTLFVLFFAVVGFQAREATPADLGIKGLMGENFGRVQQILVDLVRSDYKTVPHDVAIIEQHAAELPTLVPTEAETNRELFLSLAYNLRTQAKNLRTVVETLIQRDGTAGGTAKGQLGIDYLRTTAAAHFGHLVTTCVACHNQFRRTAGP